MINIEALDKIIAVVVVILALSLFVQSLQALLKKMFKIKSLQLETSLVHLFHYILGKDTSRVISSKLNNSPVLRMMMPRSKHPSEDDPLVKALYVAVTEEFRKVGRVTTSGKMMLDSISKEDIKKFIGKVQASGVLEKLAPGSSQKLTTIQTQLTTLETTIGEVKTTYGAVLTEAKIQFDEIENLIKPLIEDARKIFTGDTVKTEAILTDIARLEEIKPDRIRAAQDQIKQAVAKLELGAKPEAKPAIAALQAINDGLDHLAAVAAGFGSIKTLMTRLETWYDTVMQGFEERYTRGMKTWTWVISALVVIFLDANLLNIYRDISTSDAKRAVILLAADKIQKTAKDQAAAGQNDQTEIDAKKWLDEANQIINTNASAYTDIGFAGPAWISTVPQWWKENPSWPDRFRGVGKALLGWFIMTLLLSAGAPFWQDTLESLFGIKNLVRQSSGTKNVEQKSGEGQPKP